MLKFVLFKRFPAQNFCRSRRINDKGIVTFAPHSYFMDYLGYGFALVIGLVLGLTGGGGSILTVPVLVYIMHLDAVSATAYSLFIVGTTSAFGTIQNHRKGLVALRTGVMFALPSLAGVFLVRKFAIGAIPDVIFVSPDFTLTKNGLLMMAFAVIVFPVGLSMLRKPKNSDNLTKPNRSPVLVAGQLFVAGALVGLVGAGGGFLFTPLLLYVGGMDIKKAAATSLVIIAINSLVGFAGSMGNIVIDWSFLLSFTALSVIGIFIGIYCAGYINETQLKKGFAWFVLSMAVLILGKELLS